MWKFISRLQRKRQQMEQDLDREFRYHLDRREQDLINSGFSGSEAHRRAAIEFGGLAQAQEGVRDMWLPRWFHDLVRDIQYACRTLRKNLGFTSVALISLALGIGANAAIFGVFHAVLVRPLPYHDPSRLLWLMQVSQDSPEGFVLTPEFVAWRSSNRVFEGLTAWNDEQFNLTGAGNPERLVGASVSAEFLTVLGIQPALGPGFSFADNGSEAGRRALLTHELWQRRFGSDRAVVGRIVLLNDTPCTVAGVLPRGFRFPGDINPEILTNDRLSPEPDWGNQSMGMLRVIGRVREGIPTDRVLADLAAISARYELDMPGWLRMRKGATPRAIPLQQQLVGDTRPALLMLLGAVGLLLLLACVNVANLQLGRATVRQREFGLRAALGASRARIARSLIIENLTLGGLAGVAGLLVAAGILHMVRSLAGLPLPNPQDLRAGWILGGAAFVFSTVAGLAIGLVPALTIPKIDLNEVLKTGAQSLVTGRGTGVRSVLVLAQVALALILLLVSGLFLRSLQKVLAVEHWFPRRRRGHGEDDASWIAVLIGFATGRIQPVARLGRPHAPRRGRGCHLERAPPERVHIGSRHPCRRRGGNSARTASPCSRVGGEPGVFPCHGNSPPRRAIVGRRRCAEQTAGCDRELELCQTILLRRGRRQAGSIWTFAGVDNRCRSGWRCQACRQRTGGTARVVRPGFTKAVTYRQSCDSYRIGSNRSGGESALSCLGDRQRSARIRHRYHETPLVAIGGSAYCSDAAAYFICIARDVPGGGWDLRCCFGDRKPAQGRDWLTHGLGRRGA